LDRQERGQGELSATQEVSRSFGIPVVAIATLDDVLATLRARDDLRGQVPAIEAYRERYGVAA
jgi:orotate phosphoribosyltransferase